MRGRQHEGSICIQHFAQNARHCGSQLVRDSRGLRHAACNGFTRTSSFSIIISGFAVNKIVRENPNLLAYCVVSLAAGQLSAPILHSPIAVLPGLFTQMYSLRTKTFQF